MLFCNFISEEYGQMGVCRYTSVHNMCVLGMSNVTGGEFRAHFFRSLFRVNAVITPH